MKEFQSVQCIYLDSICQRLDMFIRSGNIDDRKACQHYNVAVTKLTTGTQLIKMIQKDALTLELK